MPSPLAEPLLTRPAAAGTPHYVMTFDWLDAKLVGRDYLAACWHEVQRHMLLWGTLGLAVIVGLGGYGSPVPTRAPMVIDRAG